MKTYSLKATFTVTVHIKARAKSIEAALAEAESRCFCATPLFYDSHEYDKPCIIQLEGDAWFDVDELDNQLPWEHETNR